LAQSDQNVTMTLRDYWRVIWLRRRLVVAIVILFTVLMFGRAYMQPKVYTATAQLMYNPPPNVANAASGNSTDLGSLSLAVQSVTNTIGSPAVSEAAASLMSGADRAVGYSVSAEVAVPANASSGSAVADVVNITVESGSPTAAAARANAYAKAVIQLRKESEQASWKAAQDIIQRQLDLYKTSQSKLTPDYAVLAQQLQNLEIAEASANGDFEIIVPATPPSSPSSPKPLKSAVFGFVAGLFVGVVLAFVIGQFDTRVRSYRVVSDILGLPVIGHVPRMSRRAIDHGGLVASTDSEGSVSEALRVLRRNLEWSGIDKPLKSVVVSSFSKGEGKTLTVCNLAVTLARAGSTVIIVDADLREPQVHRVFNLPNAVGLTSAVLGKTALLDAVREYREEDANVPAVRTLNGQVAIPGANKWSGRLLILPSGPLPPNPGEVMASSSVADALAQLSQSDVDYVLIDTPPLLAFGDAGALAPSADGVLVVVRIDKARRPTLEEGREALASLPGRKLGLVIVGERVDDTRYSSYASYAAGH